MREMTWLWRHYPQHYAYFRRLRARRDIGPLLVRWGSVVQNFDELKHPPDVRLLNAWMVIFYDSFREGLTGSPLDETCASDGAGGLASGCAGPYCTRLDCARRLLGRGMGLDNEAPTDAAARPH